MLELDEFYKKKTGCNAHIPARNWPKQPDVFDAKRSKFVVHSTQVCLRLLRHLLLGMPTTALRYA